MATASAALPEVLTEREVAALFRVDPKTVSRWAMTGKLDGFKTPGGHYRFPREAVLAALEDGATTRIEPSS